MKSFFSTQTLNTVDTDESEEETLEPSAEDSDLLSVISGQSDKSEPAGAVRPEPIPAKCRKTSSKRILPCVDQRVPMARIPKRSKCYVVQTMPRNG